MASYYFLHKMFVYPFVLVFTTETEQQVNPASLGVLRRRGHFQYHGQKNFTTGRGKTKRAKVSKLYSSSGQNTCGDKAPATDAGLRKKGEIRFYGCPESMYGCRNYLQKHRLHGNPNSQRSLWYRVPVADRVSRAPLGNPGPAVIFQDKNRQIAATNVAPD